MKKRVRRERKGGKEKGGRKNGGFPGAPMIEA